MRHTCDEKSCCCSCRPSRKSQERTVLSKPPVHNFEPSEEISMHDAPSVCPWNCLTNVWLCKSHTAILPSEQQLKQTCNRWKSMLKIVTGNKNIYYIRECIFRFLHIFIRFIHFNKCKNMDDLLIIEFIGKNLFFILVYILEIEKYLAYFSKIKKFCMILTFIF